MTDTDRKLAEEILLSKFPLLPAKSNKEGMDRIVLAMDEYFTERLKSLAPTEKEIENYAIEQNSYKRSALPEIAWARGARWMREKLTGKSEERRIGVTAPIVTDEEDATMKMLEDIISWEKDLSEYRSLEGVLRERYIIRSRHQLVGKTEQLPGEQGAPFDEEIK